jgi:hypothetical protein
MNWGAYIFVFLTASTKFLLSAFVAINGFKLHPLETFIIVSFGGITGTLIFYTLASRLMVASQKKRVKKIAKLVAEGKPLPKFMTKTNKLIVKTKHTFGIWGLAFLTASILSIPIGSVICAKFYKHKKHTLLLIFLFVIINAAILTLAANSFPDIGK